MTSASSWIHNTEFQEEGKKNLESICFRIYFYNSYMHIIAEDQTYSVISRSKYNVVYLLGETLHNIVT